MDISLERQIASASRSVEEARRMAYSDPARTGDLVEHISVLADLRQKEGDFRKAEGLYREALFRVQDLRKPDHELLAGIYSLLAYLYDRWGKMDLAAQFYEKALKLSEQHGFQDADKAATIKNNLAMIFKSLRKQEKAEQRGPRECWSGVDQRPLRLWRHPASASSAELIGGAAEGADRVGTPAHRRW